jgi:hypothetical protein
MLTRAKGILAALLLASLALFYANEIWRSSKSPHPPQERTHSEQPKYEAKHDNIFSDGWNWTTQDAVSFYTSVLALFTGLLAIVSSVQIRFLIRADQLARRALIANRQSALAAKRAAEALPAVERAYVFIFPELEFWDDLPHSSGVGKYASRIGVKFRLENHGKTPAAIQSISARLKVLDDPPDNRLHVTVSILPGERILKSGGDWVPDASPVNCNIDEATADRIEKREEIIWFYGSILYLDVFGTEHVTRFRWSWSPILEVFTARGDAPYNQRT